jgi:signal transduction histidine kinase
MRTTGTMSKTTHRWQTAISQMSAWWQGARRRLLLSVLYLLPSLRASWRFTQRRWHALWLHAHPLQAVAEGLLLQTLALLWGILIVPRQFSPDERAIYNGPIIVIIFISGVVSLLWAAIRMRLARRWWHGLLINSISAAVLAVAPTIILTLMMQSLLSSATPAEMQAILGSQSPLSLFITRYGGAWMVLMSGAFLFVRAGVSSLIRWNRLRRRSLVWALTNAHLLVVVIGAGILCAFIVLTNVYFTHSLEPQILPVLVFMGILTVIAVLIVLPPSLLFSYIFARRTTRRLRALANATDALRGGDYSVRVSVQGSDEVAQLQTNFNAMAADLATAVHDLEAERDTVSHLLAARRELVASVSHELRTPVATLRGYLESARSRWREADAPPSSLPHDLEIMEHEARRLQALIEDLFTLARAEVGRLDLRCAPVDVGDEVRRLAETVAPLAWQSGRVEVVAEVAPGLPLALVDSNRLNQALQNLLHNGIRHTPPGGIVAISASAAAAGASVLLQVKDTGEGIAPEDLSHIWERFYRSDRARMQSSSGSGLGLALVKELTEAMGGSVAVESALGQGSCFTITIPRADGAPAETTRGVLHDEARPHALTRTGSSPATK